jgi:hypothetical protein
MQVRTDLHTSGSIRLKEVFEEGNNLLDEELERFFKLFQESTFEGSRAAAREMKKIAKRQTKPYKQFLLYHSLYVLIRSDSKMLSWPSSPLLVLLQFIDPSVLCVDEETGGTLLNVLADLADPSDYSTHENQLILAKQLIERGASVNAVSIPQRRMPLHRACYGGNVTNLDFVELMLEAGADPNAQDHQGLTPLMCTTANAPGAAKFLLDWPATDGNIATRSGASFLASARKAVECFSKKVARPDNPYRVQHQLLLRQWRELEEMLVERGAHDTGISNLE